MHFVKNTQRETAEQVKKADLEILVKVGTQVNVLIIGTIWKPNFCISILSLFDCSGWWQWFICKVRLCIQWPHQYVLHCTCCTSTMCNICVATQRICSDVGAHPRRVTLMMCGQIKKCRYVSNSKWKNYSTCSRSLKILSWRLCNSLQSSAASCSPGSSRKGEALLDRHYVLYSTTDWLCRRKLILMEHECVRLYRSMLHSAFYSELIR